MTSLPLTETIEVSALRVGMIIHLDRAWMSHPFAQSSFRISSVDQVATLRSMGLTHVRWSPQDSDPPSTSDADAPVAPPFDLDDLTSRSLSLIHISEPTRPY